LKIILLGAPGAGKGTQAEILAKRYNIPAISTGAMIRAEIRDGSELGLKTEKYIKEGQLVPDSVIMDIVKERILKDDCKNGFILDGIPRTIPQAQQLDDMGIGEYTALNISVEDSEIIRRLSGRRVCCNCGATYHIESNPPAQSGVCDKCGEALSARSDDSKETIQRRLIVYHEQTEPLIEFYKNAGKFIEVKGDDSLEATTMAVLRAIEVSK